MSHDLVPIILAVLLHDLGSSVLLVLLLLVLGVGEGPA